MRKYCFKCKKEYSADEKKCRICGKKLQPVLSEQEEKELQKQIIELGTVNTFIF